MSGQFAYVRSSQVMTSHDSIRSVKDRSGQVTPCKVRTMVRSGLVRTNYVMSDQIRVRRSRGHLIEGQVRSVLDKISSDQVRSGQIRTGQVMSIQVRIGEVRSRQDSSVQVRSRSCQDRPG